MEAARRVRLCPMRLGDARHEARDVPLHGLLNHPITVPYGMVSLTNLASPNSFLEGVLVY